MGLLFLVVFVAIGLVEFLVFNWVVGLFGDDMTIPIILLVADSVFGALLVRQEGRKAWQRFRITLGRGIAPSEQVVDGALILFGGTLLLTPGFITDVVGVICVLGPTRKVLNSLLIRRVASASVVGRVLGARPPGPVAGGPQSAAGRRRAAGSRGRAKPDEDAQRQPPRGRTRPAGPRGGGGHDDPSGGGPPPPGVIDVEVVDVKRNKPRDGDGT